MKRILVFSTILLAVLFSCKKKDSEDLVQSIEGKWRMILVEDNVSGATTIKPASIQGDVDITFVSASTTNGSFTGNTPTNDISPSDYSVGPNQSLTIPAVSMTKVMETSWGTEFVDHIRDSRGYFLNTNGNLSIITVARILTFKRL